MKFLMLAVNTYQTPYPVYPLGASTAAAVAANSGHETRLCDALAMGGFGGYVPEAVAGAVADFRPDCVGISIRNIESADSQSPTAIDTLEVVARIVADLRPLTPAPTLLGGPGFSLLPKLFMERSGADYGIVGEAEEALPAFLAELAAGRARKGLWIKDGKRHAAAPASAAYETDLVAAYSGRGGLIGLHTKRGCPLECVYCPYPLLEGRIMRHRPVGEVLEDIRRLCGAAEPPWIAFADSVFNDSGGRWRELLRELIASGLKISWTAFFQPFGLDADDMALIRASGGAGLEFGTDAASDTGLRGLRKPFKFETVRETQNICAATGMPAAHFVTFGGPGETPESVEEGIANLESLDKCVVLAGIGLSVYPGTPLHRLALAERKVAEDEDFAKPVFYYSPRIDPGWLTARLQSAFKGRRDRLFPSSAADEKTAVLRRMGFRGLLWDTLIRK